MGSRPAEGKACLLGGSEAVDHLGGMEEGKAYLYRQVEEPLDRRRRGSACQTAEEAYLRMVSLVSSNTERYLPGKPGGGGGKPLPGCCIIGTDWPSAAYEDVIESMTDWAFSCPISAM